MTVAITILQMSILKINIDPSYIIIILILYILLLSISDKVFFLMHILYHISNATYIIKI